MGFSGAVEGCLLDERELSVASSLRERMALGTKGSKGALKPFGIYSMYTK